MAIKIFDISKILGRSDFNRFGKFIRSPFFNSEPRFVKLYELLKAPEGTLSSEIIAKEIFGTETALSEPRYRKLTSEFTKLFERFLSELEYENDFYRQKLNAAKQLYEKGESDAALSLLKQPVEQLEKEPMKDEVGLNKLIELYSLQYRITGIDYKNWKNDMSFRINDCLDEYFVSIKSNLFMRMISLEKMFHADISPKRSFEHCLRKFASGNESALSATNSDAKLHHILFEMFTDINSIELPEQYLQTLSLAETVAPAKCRPFYGDLLNFYTLLLNLGVRETESQILEIGRLMEDKGYFTQGISFVETATIVESAIGAIDYDWALDFLNRIKSNINEPNKESIFSAYAAKLHFFKKDYKRARMHINSVQLSDYIRYSESKLLECRILYEEDFVNELLLAIDKIKKYLKMHKEIGSFYRKAYSNFIESLKRLTKLRENLLRGEQISFELSKLRKEFQNSGEQIHAQAWLLEKLTELEKAGLFGLLRQN